MCACKEELPKSLPPNVHNTSFYLCVKCLPRKDLDSKSENHCHYCKKLYKILMKRKNQENVSLESSLSELNLKPFVKHSLQKYSQSIQTSKVTQNACCLTDSPEQGNQWVNTSNVPPISLAEREVKVICLPSKPNIPPNFSTELERISTENQNMKNSDAEKLSKNSYIDELVQNIMKSAIPTNKSNNHLCNTNKTDKENLNEMTIINDLVKSLIQSVINTTCGTLKSSIKSKNSNDTKKIASQIPKAIPISHSIIDDLTKNLIMSIISTTGSSFNSSYFDAISSTPSSLQCNKNPNEIPNKNSCNEKSAKIKNIPEKLNDDTNSSRQIYDEQEKSLEQSETSASTRSIICAHIPECLRTNNNQPNSDSTVSITCLELPECTERHNLNSESSSTLLISCTHLPKFFEQLKYGSTYSSVSVECSNIPNCYKYNQSKRMTNEEIKPTKLDDSHPFTEINQKPNQVSNKIDFTVKKDPNSEKNSNIDNIFKNSTKINKLTTNKRDKFRATNNNSDKNSADPDSSSNVFIEKSSSVKSVPYSNIPQRSNTSKNSNTLREDTNKISTKFYDNNVTNEKENSDGLTINLLVENVKSSSSSSNPRSNIPQCSNTSMNKYNHEPSESASIISVSCSQIPQCNRYHSNYDISSSYLSCSCSQIPECLFTGRSKSKEFSDSKSFYYNESNKKYFYTYINDIVNELMMLDIPQQQLQRCFNTHCCLHDSKNDPKLRKYLTKSTNKYRNKKFKSKSKHYPDTNVYQNIKNHAGYECKYPKYILDRVKPRIYPGNREWKKSKYNSICKQATEYHRISTSESREDLKYMFKNRRYTSTTESSVYTKYDPSQRHEYIPKFDQYFNTYSYSSEYHHLKRTKSNRKFNKTEYNFPTSDVDGAQNEYNVSSKSSFTPKYVRSKYPNAIAKCNQSHSPTYPIASYNSQINSYIQSELDKKNTFFVYQCSNSSRNTLPRENEIPEQNKDQNFKDSSSTSKIKNHKSPDCTCNCGSQKLKDCKCLNTPDYNLKNGNGASFQKKNEKNKKSKQECSQSNPCPECPDRKQSNDPNPCVMPIATEKYAIVRISDYKTYRTYEIIKTTPKKPKEFRNTTKDVFIVKKEICGLKEDGIFKSL